MWSKAMVFRSCCKSLILVINFQAERPYLTNILYNNANDTKILPVLNDAKFVALTSDYFTSRVNQTYINITVHFLKIKSYWKLEHFVVEGKELPGSHIAEHPAEAIKECMSD